LLVTEEAANAHFRAMAEQAIPSWQKQGIDLAGYTTIENAKDVEDLRIALNLSKITLFGFSYGTHLGQAYLKYYDQYVDKAILIGVEGLDDTFKQPLSMDEQFYKLSAMVAADPLIGDEIPHLVKLYQSVSQRLATTPITLTLKSPLTGKDMEVKVGKYGLDFILRCDIGDASDLPIFPRLLYSMSQGDYSVFEWFVQKRITSAYGLHAMAIGMDITSGASASRLEMINSQAQKSLFGNVVNTPYVELSKVWPVNDLGEEYRSGFTTDVPVLLLSGSLDFNTPPYQAEMLRWRLPNAQHIVVENAGHEQIQNHKQAGLAIIKFLKGEAVNDISAAYPPLQFIPLQGEVSDELWHPALGE
ncbi:MAG: alpha/beta hydrolase, partial [Bacteroidota bacterium]